MKHTLIDKHKFLFAWYPRHQREFLRECAPFSRISADKEKLNRTPASEFVISINCHNDFNIFLFNSG